MSLWNDVKKNLAELYSTTSDKSTEVLKITSRKYDKFGISREIERQFGELGNFVYTGMKEEREDLLSDPVARELVERIGALEDELRTKDEEISEIKRDFAERAARAAEAEAAGPEEEGPTAATTDAAPAATVLTDPVLDAGSDESAILVEPVEIEAAAEDLPREES